MYQDIFIGLGVLFILAEPLLIVGAIAVGLRVLFEVVNYFVNKRG